MSEITEEIRKALEAATPGPWESTNLGAVHITKDYRMQDGKHCAMWIADMCEDREDEEQIFADAWLIANTPTWLRTLLEENERNIKDKAETMRLVIQRDKEHASQLQQLREELAEEKRHAALGWEQSNKWLEENGRLRAELDAQDSWKAISELAQRESAELRTELAEKDKVLEWYAEEENYKGRAESEIIWDRGSNARTILSHYKKGESQSEDA